MATAGFAAARAAAYDAVGARQQRSQLLGLTVFERHQRLMQDYLTYYGGGGDGGGGRNDQQQQQQKPLPLTDRQVLEQTYRFIRDDGEDERSVGDWRVMLARRYYDRLYREYAIADLSRYREGKVGLRWRTKQEVVAGVGQFVCGAKRCDRRHSLASYEVPFGYLEDGERKQALVKVRLCPEHATQLNYRKLRKLAGQAKAAMKGKERRSKKDRKRSRSKSREKVSRGEEEGKRKGRSKKRRRKEGEGPNGNEGEGEGGGVSFSSGDSSSGGGSEGEGARGGRRGRSHGCEQGAAAAAWDEEANGGRGGIGGVGGGAAEGPGGACAEAAGALTEAHHRGAEALGAAPPGAGSGRRLATTPSGSMGGAPASSQDTVEREAQHFLDEVFKDMFV